MNRAIPSLDTLLGELARTYARQGYRVVSRPGPTVLPEFLSDVRPDLIGFREDENVVVEVAVGRPAGGSGEVSEIARRIQDRRGWRFDLVHVPGPSGAGRISLGADEVRARLSTVGAVAALGHSEPALLAGWSAAEAALRLLADEHGLHVDPSRPREMLRALAGTGVLEQEDYDALVNGYRVRNDVAHGFRSSADGDAFLTYLLRRAHEARQNGYANPLFGPPPLAATFDLRPGETYERRALHERFGGHRQGGISVSRDYPFIFLFTGDPLDTAPDGTVFFTGEGQTGDMQLVRGNRAILEHREDGRELHLFSYVSPGKMVYRGRYAFAGYHQHTGEDRNGESRIVIIFHLRPVSRSVEVPG